MHKILAGLAAVVLIAACAASDANSQASPPSTASAPASSVCAGAAGNVCSGEQNYCHIPDGVCASNPRASGKCEPKPDLCPMIYTPVCGCDGKTYPNACVAASKGASIASQGACKSG